jgi:hypothetical protein
MQYFSLETRKAVLDIVSDDHHNPLVEFAAKNSTAKASPDKRTLQCSGAISAGVGDVKASKEIGFTVQRSADGKLSVSVTPFQFQGVVRAGDLHRQLSTPTTRSIELQIRPTSHR